MEREVGGGIGMGNTCKPMAVSFQCMTKSTTIKKNNNNNKKPYLQIRSTSEVLGIRTSLICKFFVGVEEGTENISQSITLTNSSRSSFNCFGIKDSGSTVNWS